ncbi:hypothetical protein SPBR_04681 [Sporothrix brasiliensis 5110]|uniref:Uncharacterized protein n=1 Tax=Sporothrix brasiliensis 5110 TaxID=1398154 RepID=A0A0C2ID05_9PEZI|nr:uncharacterized protein SPBR_04681 [Sporothrix brasiliensis 5110]KIH87136.1 hypothetical protein SPBR_04681 [Sporothrix brasiliensis 5110]
MTIEGKPPPARPMQMATATAADSTKTVAQQPAIEPRPAATIDASQASLRGGNLTALVGIVGRVVAVHHAIAGHVAGAATAAVVPATAEFLGHRGRGKLPRGRLLGKQPVERGVGAALGLGQTQPGPEPDGRRQQGPDEADGALEVEGAGVQQVGLGDVGGDGGGVVGVAGEADGALAQAGGADLGGHGPAELADGQLEHKGPGERQGGLDEADGDDGASAVQQPQHADGRQEAGHGGHAAQEDGAAAVARHEDEPVAEGADERETRAARVEQVRGVRGQADLLEEVGRVVRKGRAGQDLRGKGHAGDFRAAALGAAEAVGIRRLGGAHGGLFHGVGPLDGGQRGVNVGARDGRRCRRGRRLQARQGLARRRPPARAHEVPRRLGRKAQHGEDDDGPQPLQGKGDAKGPLVVGAAVDEGGQDGGGDELAQDEAHVGPGGQVAAEGGGQQLGGVGGGGRGEDAPGEAAEQLADEEHGDGRGEEGEADEGAEDGEGGEEDALVAVAGDEVAVEGGADKAADGGGVGEGGHPGGGELVLAVLVDELAVLGSEGGIGEEVADAGSVRERDETPENGLAVDADGLADGEVGVDVHVGVDVDVEVEVEAEAEADVGGRGACGTSQRRRPTDQALPLAGHIVVVVVDTITMAVTVVIVVTIVTITVTVIVVVVGSQCKGIVFGAAGLVAGASAARAARWGGGGGHGGMRLVTASSWCRRCRVS